MSSNLLFWLIVVIVLVVIELATIQLVAIWPALGGVVAMLAASFDQPLLVQFLLFLIVSAVLLIFTRPLLRRFVRTPPKTFTNADRLIGREAVVCERIDNLAETGAVIVSGVTWTARSDSGIAIPDGAKVCIERIEGVKLIVSVK
ncbi:MAG: NfeD family protein [Ethanoligenens sp.]|uniref:NfeD family protein n=1 Tax=Ethanoligenens sp. TaxID=2099655 RepID=UPI0039EB56D9